VSVFWRSLRARWCLVVVMWMLRSSAKSMGVIGCGMTENMSLIAIKKSVPLSGDP